MHIPHVMPETVRRPLKKIQPAVDRPDPYLMVPILAKSLDAIRRQPPGVVIPMDIMHKLARGVHPVQPAILRTHPDGPAAIPQKTQHQVARQTGGVVGVMPEMYEFIRPTVIPVQSPAPGTDPQIPTAIL